MKDILIKLKEYILFVILESIFYIIRKIVNFLLGIRDNLRLAHDPLLMRYYK